MLSASLLALLGFSLLALSQDRHYDRVFESNWPENRPQGVRRAIGFTALALALPLCIAADGAGFGSLLWVVLISAAAMAVAFALTWRPHWLRWARLIFFLPAP